MYLIMHIHGVHQNCTSLFSPYTNQYRYRYRYVRYEGGLLLGVGDGGRGVRYRIFFQKNCSGSGEVDQRALSKKPYKIFPMTLEYFFPCYVLYGEKN